MMILLLALLAQSPSPAASLRLTPVVAGDIDFGKLKGNVRRLAWSPDGATLYLETYEQNRDASVKAVYRYTVSTKDASVKPIADEPQWVADYWLWKSNKWAPGDEAFAIEIEQSQKRQTATATPMGGDAAKGGMIAGGGGGLGADAAMSAAEQSHAQNVYTMRLRGEVVGEWVDQPIVPGLTFGWGPQGTGVIAFAEKNGGKLVLMDKTGAKQKLDGTKNVVAPAFTTDGARLAWLEGRGGKKFALVIATVSR